MVSKYFRAKNLETLLEEKISLTKAKGIDKLSPIKAFQDDQIDFALVQKKISTNKFEFSPYLELLKIKKRDSLPRMLSIPTARDRVVLLGLKEYLHSHFKSQVNTKLPNSYIRDIKKFISSNKGKKIYFIKADIESFFAKIEHSILIKKMAKHKLPKYILNLIEKAIMNPTVPKAYRNAERIKYQNNLGVPQGLAISNILAQLYLAELDKNLNKKNILYLRYVDDIMILMSSNRINLYSTSLILELNKVKLNLNTDKSLSGELNKMPLFLGYKLLNNSISVSDKNIETLIQKIAGKITWLKNCLADPIKRPKWIKTNKRLKEVFIEELNEKITGAKSKSKNYGWLFYFVEMDDKSLLFKLDNVIERMIIDSKVFKSRPNNLKKLVRSFFEIKYNNGGNYIVDYDKVVTIIQKRQFLLLRGRINATRIYTDEQLEEIFEKYKNKNLKELEEEVGYKYF